jgi:hypothetical protein
MLFFRFYFLSVRRISVTNTCFARNNEIETPETGTCDFRDNREKKDKEEMIRMDGVSVTLTLSFCESHRKTSPESMRLP